MKKFFAKLFYSIISKKFVVFCTATWLLWYDKLDSMYWTICATAYISIELAQKIFIKKDEE